MNFASTWIVNDYADCFQQMWCVTLCLAAACPRDSLHCTLDKVLSRLPSIRSLFRHLADLVRRKSQNAADDCEWKFQVQIHTEGSDVSKSVPDRAPHGQVDWLDFDGEPETIEKVKF